MLVSSLVKVPELRSPWVEAVLEPSAFSNRPVPPITVDWPTPSYTKIGVSTRPAAALWATQHPVVR